MPTINIQLFEGRTPEQKRALVKSITEATCTSLRCHSSSVEIILHEIKRENWATGGTLWSEVGAGSEEVHESVRSGMNYIE